MPRVIVKRQLPYHPLLGRNVNHDSESRRYPVRVDEEAQIVSIQHKRYVPFFDQGQIGSCTGNAGDGCTATGAFFDVLNGAQLRYGWDEAGAVSLYSRATELDDYQGTYPEEDTGSDGLSVAKALKEAGEISGYLHAFTPQSARAALMQTPLITGINWYEDMFLPTADGQVVPGSSLAGGHEIVVAGYVLMGSRPSNDDQVWFDNSWGNWGVIRPGQTSTGSFWMTFGDWSELFQEQGDVTQFVPINVEPPNPDPGPGGDEHPAGDTLWTATKHWAHAKHYGSNHDTAKALLRFASDTGRS